MPKRDADEAAELLAPRGSAFSKIVLKSSEDASPLGDQLKENVCEISENIVKINDLRKLARPAPWFVPPRWPRQKGGLDRCSGQPRTG
jgi:hypothetical protein